MPKDASPELDVQTSWISRSKNRVPQFQVELVERPRLLALLENAKVKRFSFVVGPAGFGKSTLLSQWHGFLLSRGDRCAWITLDENDREFRHFAAYLVLAFESSGVTMGKLRPLAERGFIDMSSPAIFSSVLAELSEINERVVLILDDYHKATCDEIDRCVRLISNQFGNKIHITIGSRQPVDIGAVELLAAGQAVEITASMLRFSDREVKKAVAGELDKEGSEALHQYVEGWPVAVQMGKLLAKSSNATPNFKALGRQTVIAEYLVSNVLGSQSEELQDFLLTTSVLDSFNAELANAVCCHRNSLTLIRQMKSLNALVLPLDDEGEWYRFHHLFAEILREKLKADQPEKFKEAHQRAAIWCGQNKMIEEAVSYASEIGDHDLALSVFADNSMWIRYYQYGGLGYTLGILNKIPEEFLVNDLSALNTKIYSCIMQGDSRSALKYNSIAEDLAEYADMSIAEFVDRINTSSGVLVQTGFDRDRDSLWLQKNLDIVEALTKKFPMGLAVTGILRTSIALESVSYGDFEKAQGFLEVAEKDFSKVGFTVANLYFRMSKGWYEFVKNRPLAAVQEFYSGLKEANRRFGNLSNFSNFFEMYIGVSNYWRNSVQGEGGGLRKAVSKAVQGGGGFDLYSVGFDALMHDAICSDGVVNAKEFVDGLHDWTDRIANDRLKLFWQVLSLDCETAMSQHQQAKEAFNSVTTWLYVDDVKLEDLGWFLRSTARHACARYLRSVGDHEGALALIERAIDDARSIDSVLFKVRGNVLKASVLEEMNCYERMFEALSEATSEAQRTHCVRPFFADVSANGLRIAVQRLRKAKPTSELTSLLDDLEAMYLRGDFTAREIEVLHALADGCSNKEIARRFNLSPNTVKFHLSKIYQKLGVESRGAAVEKVRAGEILSWVRSL
ncbi:MAG: LuxR C-terminal-related transcriptional regulator [Pseudomonadota bacterium]